MKRFVAATLVAFGLLAGTQASFAGNFKHAAGTQAKTKGATTQSSHGAQGLLLGTFETDCDFFNFGSASGEFQTIQDSSNHNQTTVHLRAKGGAAAYCDLENTLSTPVTVKTPISFNLVKGNGNYLGVEVLFIPHGSTTETFIDFATPNSKLFNLFEGVVPMIDNGNGYFTLPLGDGITGIPQGSQLTGLFFVQFANPKDCDNKNSHVNHLTVNNRGVGLDLTQPSASCDLGCGEEQPAGR